MTSQSSSDFSPWVCTSAFRTVLILAAFVATPSTTKLRAQGTGEEIAELEEDLLAAQEESLRQGVPLMILAIGKSEENKALSLLSKEWFVNASKDFLLVILDPEEHGYTKVLNRRGGRPRYILACKLFRNAPCGNHRGALLALTKELKLPKDREGLALLPQLLFLSPDQRILSHWGKLPSDERLRVEMKLAQRRLDQGFSATERETLNKKFKLLRKRFMKARSARNKMIGNELMALPDPKARRFLREVALGKIDRVRRPHRITALEVLSVRGSYDALPPLLSALGDPDVRIRDAALEGLAEVRLQKAAIPILDQSKAWKKPPDYEKLALALIRSDPKSPRVQAWFGALLAKGRPEHRLHVLEALLLFEHPTPHWSTLVEASTKMRNRRVQEKAARVLATFESRK